MEGKSFSHTERFSYPMFVHISERENFSPLNCSIYAAECD